MSYESMMLEKLQMPSRENVEKVLLKVLFENNGTVKEFSKDEKIVDIIANKFELSEKQRDAYLETIYRKENRVKRSILWHRLLFRAADSLAKKKLVSRPTSTVKLTNKKEWMLTELGFDKVLKLLNIPKAQKDYLQIKSYEIQKIVKKLQKVSRPLNYNPFTEKKRNKSLIKETTLRLRGFRQAVIEAYDSKCSVCGLKIYSPNQLSWEVEAAHIVPHHVKGKDDILNGIALCRFHHWAFDVGWFTLNNDYSIQVSSKIKKMPEDFGKIASSELLNFAGNNSMIFLPITKEMYPHENALEWHRQNIFFQ